ncbi:porin [Paracidovorax wautersii]|uniref:Porin n=1 Tax=Paracidovorax wautersii TaxID=1177982 RepID=A0ABU1I537_9BURK|nr:porin [Paracidovorax wautersii]MDR6212328.1 putative porin [Paracidovorax wautersii]
MRLSTALHTTGLLSAIALAFPAAAQSDVSVSGFVDGGVFRDFDKTSKAGTIQRSNLAFQGIEDLGGGMQATFRLSTRFDIDTGTPEGEGAKPFWHDESTVGLKGEWGAVRLGRALSAMWAQDWQFDPWANFNRISSPAWYFWHAQTPTDRASNNGSPEYGRMANGVFYDSPTLGGFTVHLSASPERTTAPGSRGRGHSASLNYSQGPVSAMLAHERNGSGDRDLFVAGKYDFGAVAVMGAYDDSRTAGPEVRARAATLGAAYTVGATVFKAGYGRQRIGDATNHFASLGADHALSKRTTVYASLGHQRYEDQPSRTAFGVGIGHAF